MKSGERVAVGVSGGADSIALLYALFSLREVFGIEVFAVHINHGIRGAAAARDEELVGAFCEREGIRFYRFETDVPREAKRTGLSLEECGRVKRYEIFDSLIREGKCEKVALAHHKGDQAETLMMRILRGTGVNGLVGMKPIRGGVYIRPMLNILKDRILEFVREKGLPCATDETNLDNAYTRNFIRNEVFPLLKTRYPDLETALCRLAENAGETVSLTESGEYKVAFDGQTAEFSTEVLESAAVKDALDRVFFHFGITSDIEARHATELKKLIAAENGSGIDLPFGVRAVKEYGRIAFFRPKKNEGLNIDFFEVLKDGVIETDDKKIVFTRIPKEEIDADFFKEKRGIEAKNDAEIKDSRTEEKNSGAETKNGGIEEKKKTLYLDLDKIPKDARIRFCEDGDVFQKLGGGRKKLCDYFTDIKLERRLRETTPLIVSGHNVLAVIGREISEGVKVDKGTEKILFVFVSDQFVDGDPKKIRKLT
ncbi:MAG: tRNA lysidine(34) synthetase TilS [Clostridiales bacterium]|nr:tRNA lysidine(34) synthetase TilS [Clostridiales bacterium]